MEAQPDFKELLELFNAQGVEYLIIGGYALAFHGAPRYTGDIDLLVKADLHNAQKVMNALREFGFGAVGLSSDDFAEPEQVIELGVPPVRVDIVTSITGVSWEQAEKHRVSGRYGGVPTFFISREDFIKNKRAIGRLKDLADIEALGDPTG